MEEYEIIKDYSNYSVSNLGNIKKISDFEKINSISSDLKN